MANSNLKQSDLSKANFFRLAYTGSNEFFNLFGLHGLNACAIAYSISDGWILYSQFNESSLISYLNNDGNLTAEAEVNILSILSAMNDL